MDTFFTGFVFGIIVSISSYIFIWFIRRGKGDTPGTLKSRVDRNNLDTGRGIDKLEKNNQESGRIIDEAKKEAGRGVKSIEDTERAVSGIIKSAIRDAEKELEG